MVAEPIRDLGLRCIAVSNTNWRNGDDYRRDFAALGIGDAFDAIVTSVDVGYRKPHRAMFEAALAAAGGAFAECVMIGNSEAMDVAPALALGLRVIRVAIEEPLPARSEAHAVVDSLAAAAVTLRAWVPGARG